MKNPAVVLTELYLFPLQTITNMYM